MWTFERSRKSRVEGSIRPAFVSCLLSTAFCLLVSTISLFAARGRYEVFEVRPHIFVWVPEDIQDLEGDPEFSRAGTAGFIVTEEGVVVVNTTNHPFHARELLYEIRRKTEQPIKYVVNTDSRPDHILGNEVFAEQQATILSTSQALAQMRQYQDQLRKRMEENVRLQTLMRGIHLTLPNQTFDGEMALRIGGQELKLLVENQGPTAGEATVYLPAAKIIFLGDLYENGLIPARLESIDLGRWTEALRRAENWGAETYVPGHGAPGDRQEFAEFRRWLEWAADVQMHGAGGNHPPQARAN